MDKKTIAGGLLTLLLIFACSSEEIPTEEKRKNADPRAAQFLIQSQDAFKNKWYGFALALADSAESLAPELADVYFQRGLVLTALRRYEDAEKAYQKVISLDPNYRGARMNMGSTALRQGDQDRALKYYRQEFKAFPAPGVLHQIGRVYAEGDQPDSARIFYERAISLDSSFATAYLRIGELLKEQGELEEAIEYARSGLKIQPESINYQYFLGSLLQLAGESEEAAGILQNVVEKQPWHYWGNYNLGQALMRLGKEEQGKRYLAEAESLQVKLKDIQDWQALAEANPDQHMLWVNLGEAFRRAGRIDEAIEAHNVALSIDPTHVALRNNIANMYILSGDTTAGVFHYETILGQHPYFPDVWLNLGVVYAKRGNVKLARETWEKGLKYAPGDSILEAYIAKLPAEY